ncbi:MAG: autotransporter assembly complex protein TamA [Stenotrophobium sp.]
MRILLILLCAFPAVALAGVDVHVYGLGDDEADNAYAQIGLLSYAKATDAAKAEYDPEEVQRRFEQGVQDIRNALQPFGWYNPHITSVLHGSTPDWTAIYTVDPGPPTDIAKIDIQIAGDGKDDAALQRILKHPRLHLGQQLNHVRYEDLKSRLMQAALAGGYLDASFSRHELRVDPGANAAEILLTLDTGPRYYFGAVTIGQDGQLDDAFLRRYLRVTPGAPFDAAQLLATQFAFTDLGYFQSVEVEAQKSKADALRQIPVVIRTTPKKPQVYRIGAGYGTDTGARALAGVEFRRLNKQGHKLRLELRPSQNISTAIAEYRIPVGTHPGDAISFTGQGLRQNFQGISENLYSIGTAYERQLGRWQRRYYLIYTSDDYTLKDQAAMTSVLLTPGVQFSRSELNDPIYPRRGWFVSLDLHGASTRLLSDTDFIEGLFRLRGVYPLARGLRVLARIEEGGALVSGFQTLPPSQRFFAGGDDSVRGYSYQSLGPTDSMGNVIGGKYLSTGSVELDYDVYKNYGAALFADAGGADDVPNVLLHYGAGVGFRYRAPFGVIAIDLAHPFDRGASPVRLHIGMRVGL